MGNCLGKKGKSDKTVEYYKETEKLREEGAEVSNVDMNTSMICETDRMRVAMNDDFVTHELESFSSDHHSPNKDSLNMAVLHDKKITPTNCDDLATPIQSSTAISQARFIPASGNSMCFSKQREISALPLDIIGIENEWYCDVEDNRNKLTITEENVKMVVKSDENSIDVADGVSSNCIDRPVQCSHESQMLSFREEFPSSSSGSLDQSPATITVVSNPKIQSSETHCYKASERETFSQDAESPLVQQADSSQEESPHQDKSSYAECSQDTMCLRAESPRVESLKRLSMTVSIIPPSSHHKMSSYPETMAHSTPNFLIPIDDAMTQKSQGRTMSVTNISLAATPMSVSAMSLRASHLSCHSDNYSPVYRLQYNLATGDIHRESLDDQNKQNKLVVSKDDDSEACKINLATGDFIRDSLDNVSEKAGKDISGKEILLP